MKLLLKILIVIFTSTALTIASVTFFKSEQYQSIRARIVEARAVIALEKIRKLTADQIITDEVVGKTIRENDAYLGYLRGASWAAREAVFGKHQCYIFNLGYSDIEGVCNTARYSEGLTNKNVWYENKGIPVSIAPIIAEMRKELYQIGRTFLANPENLRSSFEAKTDIIIDEYKQLSNKKKQAFQDMISIAAITFEQFRDDDLARSKYTRYIELEKLWQVDESDSLDLFSAWEKSEKELDMAVVNKELYLFAGRRWAEGGDKLIFAYIDIMNKLKATIKK